MHLCVQVWRPEEENKWSLTPCLTLLRQSLSANLELGWQVSLILLSPLHTALELHLCLAMPPFYVDAGDLNFGPNACTAHALPH